ncbi:UNVERIFIED_CONTAM: hypothetical protein NCL1_43396 [Trichonephila clavipes]
MRLISIKKKCIRLQFGVLVKKFGYKTTYAILCLYVMDTVIHNYNEHETGATNKNLNGNADQRNV